MRKEDKVMFGNCTKSMRKEIITSYRISRVSHAESEKKGKTKK